MESKDCVAIVKSRITQEQMTNSLFSFGNDRENNACLNWSKGSIKLYIEGYRKAADALVHKVVESSSDQDILVYPIAFLYRQYIELQLKSIIQDSRVLLSEDSGFPEHHKIKTLWEVAHDLMKKIISQKDISAGEYITKEDIELIDKIINEFDKVDPGSFAFRYPKDKCGNINLEGIIHINLRDLHDQIDLLQDKLEKFDVVIGLLNEWENEWRSEMRSICGV